MILYMVLILTPASSFMQLANSQFDFFDFNYDGRLSHFVLHYMSMHIDLTIPWGLFHPGHEGYYNTKRKPFKQRACFINLILFQRGRTFALFDFFNPVIGSAKHPTKLSRPSITRIAGILNQVRIGLYLCLGYGIQ